MELLAPAGSREALAAAVEAGADAVYLAGQRFGARAYAGNFDEDGLREAIRFAHLRHVAVHVAVNTIVADAELPELAGYLRFLHDAGADAVLLQDLGAARLARDIVPGLPLHASTQMTVHSLEGVLALKELGFSRAVLSRELSLPEIRSICARAGIEIEVFVHGALCVCYSGQCLMSSMIGARSGNRGRCAQPCRLPYTLVDADGNDVLAGKAGEYLLSPRDLNAIELLPELIEAGVASLKIEGRMKRPEYVAVAVESYRRALAAYGGGQAYAVPEESRQGLRQIFNRDFTAAYLKGIPGRDMMSDRRPNNRGVPAGRALGYDRAERRVTAKLSGALSCGDQVEFWVKVGGRVAATVEDMRDVEGRSLLRGQPGQDVSFPLPAPVHAHDRMFKVCDAGLMAHARQYFASGAPVRRVPVRATARASLGKPFALRLEDADGNVAEAATRFLAEPARNRPLAADTVEKQLARLGTTIFSLEACRTDIEPGIMVPVSELNEARRKAVALLEEQRLRPYLRRPAAGRARPPLSPLPPDTSPAELSVAVDSLPMLEAAIEAGADALLFGGESWRREAIEPRQYERAAAMARAAGKRIFFGTPRIVREAEQGALEELLALAGAADGVYVHNIGTLRLARRLCRAPIHTDFSLIAFHRLTLDFLRDYGVAGATLSPELSWSQVAALAAASPLPLECIVHGRLELMVSSCCVTGYFLGGRGKGPCSRPCRKGAYRLRDRKGMEFPLGLDQFCRMHVLNSRPLSMLPHAAAFGRAGIRRMRIEARAMGRQELRAAVEAYQRLKRCTAEELGRQRDEIRQLEGQSITRGHYFRGVT